MTGTDQAQPKKKTRVCPWWLAYTFDNPLRRMVHPPEKILGDYVWEGMQVLDIGCGFGHFTIGLARLVGPSGRVTALDLQEQMLRKTMSRAKKRGVADVVQPKLSNGDDLGQANSFDFVLASNVLHEVPDQAVLIAQVAVVLKPEGLFYIMEPFGHVKIQDFEKEIGLCRAAGLLEVTRPKVKRERCVLVQKPGQEKVT